MTRTRRRHRDRAPQNHERWLVSYADFMTLLFAFFVVMYAVSSVNEGKYRVLSEVLETAFRAPARTLEPIQFGKPVKSPVHYEVMEPRPPTLLVPDLRPMPPARIPPERLSLLRREAGEPAPVDGPLPEPAAGDPAPADPMAGTAPEPEVAETAVVDDPLAVAAQRIRGVMDELIQADLVQLRRTGAWVEVEIRDQLIFPSASARVSTAAEAPLLRLADILREMPNRLLVEGFTDDIPIRTPLYPSNWELSAARAASVVNLLTGAGIRPERLAAVGYGEHRPIADNATQEGRRRNRRVVLVILGEQVRQRGGEAPQGQDEPPPGPG